MAFRKKIHRRFNTTYMKVKYLRNKRTNINILITTFAIVMIWRGVWGFLDFYLFPQNPFLSYLISIVLGVLLLFIDNEELDELEGK